MSDPVRKGRLPFPVSSHSPLACAGKGPALGPAPALQGTCLQAPAMAGAGRKQPGVGVAGAGPGHLFHPPRPLTEALGLLVEVSETQLCFRSRGVNL